MRDIREHIIYEDNDICVCHKPSGMLTQSDRGFSQDLASALMTYERKKGNKSPFIAPVNRLDRPVEGLVLYAKNSRSAAALTKQITKGEVDKCYYAVVKVADLEAVESAMREKRTITLENYLLKDAKTNMSRVVTENTEGAKKAVLEYEVLSVNADEKTAFLKVKLHTGRHHQIRVQLSNAGMPLVGDAKYGAVCGDTYDAGLDKGGVENKSVSVKRGDNLALCSYRLVFAHPVTKKKLTFEVIPKGKSFEPFFENKK